MQKSRILKTARKEKEATSPKRAAARPLPEPTFPADMGPSFCRFVRHMLQGTAARLVISDMVTDSTRSEFTRLIGKLEWNGSGEEAKAAVEGAIGFLVNLQKAHKKAGDKPFSYSEDKELFFRNIYLARLYLGKVLNMLTGGPHLLVKEDMSLMRIIGDTVALLKANGASRGKCEFRQFAGCTVMEIVDFMRQNPKHPASEFVRENPKMTLGELVAYAQREGKDARRKKPFEVDYEPGTGTDMLNVDRIEVFLLFENLLANAMRAGATRVEITSEKSVSNPAMAEIVVRDNGRGFTQRQLKKANRGESFSTKKKGTGEMHGVGLAHCSFIAEQHGGTFSIESQRGRGATISFTLPLSKQE